MQYRNQVPANVVSNGQFNSMFNAIPLRNVSCYPIRQQDDVYAYGSDKHLTGAIFPKRSAADIKLYTQEDMQNIYNLLYPNGCPDLVGEEDYTLNENYKLRKFINGYKRSGGYHPNQELLNILNKDVNIAIRILTKNYGFDITEAYRVIRHYRVYGECKNVVYRYINPYNRTKSFLDHYEIYGNRYGQNNYLINNQMTEIRDLDGFLASNILVSPNIFKHSNYTRMSEYRGVKNIYVENRVDAQQYWGPMLYVRYPYATKPVIDWETQEEILVNVNSLSFYYYNGFTNDPSKYRYIYNPWKRYGKYALDGIKRDLATNGLMVYDQSDSGTCEPKPITANGVTRFVKRLNLEFDSRDIDLLRRWGIHPEQITNDIELDGQYMDSNKRLMEINSLHYATGTYDSTQPNYTDVEEPVDDIVDENIEPEVSSSLNNTTEEEFDERNLLGVQFLFEEQEKKKKEVKEEKIDDIQPEIVDTKVYTWDDNITYDPGNNIICKVVKVNSESLKLQEVYTKCYDSKKKQFNGSLYNQIVAELSFNKDYEFSKTFKVPADGRSAHPIYKGIPNEFVLSTMFSEVPNNELNNFFTTILNTPKDIAIPPEPNTAKYYCSIRFTNNYNVYTSRKIFCKDDNNVIHSVVDIDLSNGGDDWVDRKYKNNILRYNPKKIVNLFAHHIGDKVNGGEYDARNKHNHTMTEDGFRLLNFSSGRYDGIYIVTINNYYTDNTPAKKDLTGVILNDNDANKKAIAYNGESLHSNSMGLLYNTSNTEPLGNMNSYLVNRNGTRRIIKIDFIPYSALEQLDKWYNMDNRYYYSDKLSMLFTTNGFEPNAHNLDYLSKHDTEGYLKHRIQFSNMIFYNDIKIKTDINPLLENDLERYFNSLGMTTTAIKSTTLDKALPINEPNVNIEVTAYLSKESKYNKEYLYYGIKDGCMRIPKRDNDIIKSNLFINGKKIDIIRITYNRYGERPSFIDMPLEDAHIKLLIYTRPEAAIDRISIDEYIKKYQPDLAKDSILLEQKHAHERLMQDRETEIKNREIDVKNRELNIKERIQSEANEIAREKITSLEKQHNDEMALKDKELQQKIKELQQKDKQHKDEMKQKDKEFRLRAKESKMKAKRDRQELIHKLKNDKDKIKIERDKIKIDQKKIANARDEFEKELKFKNAELIAKTKEAEKNRQDKIREQAQAHKHSTTLLKIKAQIEKETNIDLKKLEHAYQAIENEKDRRFKAGEAMKDREVKQKYLEAETKFKAEEAAKARNGKISSQFLDWAFSIGSMVIKSYI